MTYNIIRVTDHPYFKETMARWFHDKWDIPEALYLQSMEEALTRQKPYPQWYVALDKGRIIGGLGVIENDFHNRKDLSPNVCAVYTEPDYRGQGIAGELLNFVCEDMSYQGISTLYLVTDHTEFYERYGWSFFCEVQGEGEETTSRLYIHQYHKKG